MAFVELLLELFVEVIEFLECALVFVLVLEGEGLLVDFEAVVFLGCCDCLLEGFDSFAEVAE